jgi:hypothetical protein
LCCIEAALSLAFHYDIVLQCDRFLQPMCVAMVSPFAQLCSVQSDNRPWLAQPAMVLLHAWRCQLPLDAALQSLRAAPIPPFFAPHGLLPHAVGFLQVASAFFARHGRLPPAVGAPQVDLLLVAQHGLLPHAVGSRPASMRRARLLRSLKGFRQSIFVLPQNEVRRHLLVLLMASWEGPAALSDEIGNDCSWCVHDELCEGH